MIQLKLCMTILMVGLFSQTLMAAEPNFKCDIFGENVSGSFDLTGTDLSDQTYNLEVRAGSYAVRNFAAKAYMNGRLRFSDLPMETQQAMINAMSNSRRPTLETGDLLLFTNTANRDESTLNIFLMPSGQIGYLQIGVLEAFCM